MLLPQSTPRRELPEKEGDTIVLPNRLGKKKIYCETRPLAGAFPPSVKSGLCTVYMCDFQSLYRVLTTLPVNTGSDRLHTPYIFLHYENDKSSIVNMTFSLAVFSQLPEVPNSGKSRIPFFFSRTTHDMNVQCVLFFLNT